MKHDYSPPGAGPVRKLSTEPTGPRPLTPKGIVDIIAACRENGVLKLSFGDLQLEFGLPAIPTPVVYEQAPMPTINLTEEERSALEDEAYRALELEEKQRELDNALIEDPSLYERLHAIEDLTK